MRQGYARVLGALNSDQVEPKYHVLIHYDRRANKRQVTNDLDHDGELPSAII
jgi:hypothetical protein